jgi:hypothetical protein
MSMPGAAKTCRSGNGRLKSSWMTARMAPASRPLELQVRRLQPLVEEIQLAESRAGPLQQALHRGHADVEASAISAAGQESTSRDRNAAR